MDKLDMPWRSFADDGTIFTKWNAGTPSYYILDAKGVIRYKWIGSPGAHAIDAAVETLLKEAEEKGKKSPRDKLVGVWAGYAVEGKGEKPDQGPVRLELTIFKDLIKARQFKGDKVFDLGEGTFEITLDKSPNYLDGDKKIDNPKRKEIWLGIYQLDGDTLKWCVGKKTRPTAFETKQGAFLLILKRKSQ
jgi:uncharacterized protein (TIGR03067 family)